MTDSELRELDDWIAEHVMGYKPRVRKFDSTYPELRYWNKGNGYEILQQQFRPTTDSFSAMEVLKKCLEKLAWENSISFGTSADGDYFIIAVGSDLKTFCDVEAETLELVICLFSKKLFTK